MGIIRWKLAWIISIVGFALVFVTLPFSKIISTLLFLGLLSLWSRVPISFIPFGKNLELSDFLAVVIGVQYGGITAAAFGAGIIMITRIFCPLEHIHFTIKESIARTIIGLTIPLAYAIVNQNFLVLLYIYSFSVAGFYLLETLFLDPEVFWMELGIVLTEIPTNIISNLLYWGVLEDFLSNLAKEGIKLNLQFLMLSSVIGGLIAISYFLSKYKSPKRRHELEKEKPIKSKVFEYTKSYY